MTRRARIGWSILALALIVVAWSEWSLSHAAPEPVARAFDTVVATLLGRDPETRCRRADGRFVAKRECHVFRHPALYSGFFVDEFEGQRFVPFDPQSGDADARRIWFSTDDRTDTSGTPAFARLLTAARDGNSRLWRVRFVGRETRYPGGYGHFGMSRRLILADRMVEAQLLATYDGYLPENLNLWSFNSGNRR